MKKPIVFTTVFFCFLLFILTGCLPQDEYTEHEHGTVHFPISCSEEAQQKWEEAAQLELGYPDVIDWGELPETKALFSYARGLGAARTGDLDQAEEERDRIKGFVSDLREAGNDYWAYMTEALGKAVESWTLYERGETEEALTLMSEAADLEDSMDKHPTSPGEVLPVRELYGELLLKEYRTEEAIAAFEASLERTPNRRNAQNRVEQITGAEL